MENNASAEKKGKPSSASFKVGAIALAFLVIGYQAALLVSRASLLRIEANRDRPDTVFVYQDDGTAAREFAVAEEESGMGVGLQTRSHPRLRKREGPAAAGSGRGPTQSDGLQPELPSASSETLRRNTPHSGYVQQDRRATRRVESFRFNPNTVSVEDLIRLGFSEKQAQAIDNYRTKGGRFRRKADFAKSFVVADSVFRRLEPFIDIPRVDLNRADSAALDALPGIGPYYAAKIVGYRAELGGYSYPEQLMDLYRFDREKYDALQDLVFCSKPAPYALWTLPADSLRKHPYIHSRQAARAIVMFRENTPREDWTVQALSAAGILPEEDAHRLSRCVIAEP